MVNLLVSEGGVHNSESLNFVFEYTFTNEYKVLICRFLRLNLLRRPKAILMFFTLIVFTRDTWKRFPLATFLS